MLSEESCSPLTSVSIEDLFYISADQLLKPFEPIVNLDIHSGMYLDFQIQKERKNHKVSPILRVARVEDVREIVKIYKELYEGTYLYKEMEDEAEIRKMIADPSIEFVIFQDPTFRGFMLKKQFQGHIDITKAMVGSMIGVYFTLLNIALILNILGASSYSLLGIFSVDQIGPHGVFAIIAFLGFVLSIDLISVAILCLPTAIPNYLGCMGLILPLSLCGLNCVYPVPIIEWLLLGSILLFLFPIYFKMLRN